MSEEIIKKAIFALDNGQIICYPTDTLYGLGADIKNENAIKKVFNIKKRPFNMPISVAVSGLNEIDKIAYLNDFAKIIIKEFLPGKLSIILEKKENVSDILTAGLKKISIRIPDNDIALKILDRFGPITCTSANVHSEPTPNLISDINMCFKEKITVYIDGGELTSKASTIVDLSNEEIKIIRKGSITKDELWGAINNG